MSGYDDLERQLLDSVARRRRRRFPAWLHRRRPINFSGIMIGASCAVVLAIAAFAIVSLGRHKPPVSVPAAITSRHHTSQNVGSPQQQSRELNYINAALHAVVAKDPACGPGAGPNPAGATISEGAPSGTMLSVLDVLRRPATPADRLPARFTRNGHLLVARIADGVYVRYIRLARVVNGVRYYIIPAARVGALAPPARVLNRCYSEEMRALRSQLVGVPASLRASTISFGAVLFGQTRTSRASDRIHEGVFEFEFGPSGGGGGGGESPEMLEQHGMLGTDGPVLNGVVPSGVATVTLEFPASGHGKHRLPPLTVTTDVVGDVFAVSIPRVNGGDFPPKMIWRSALGNVIKTVSTPH